MKVKIKVLIICLLFYRGLLAQVSIPYCDNFDAGTLWTVNTISGTPWQIGQPQLGSNTTAHSLPNCFAIGLNSLYQNLTKSYLTTPTFNLSGMPNSRLSFWLNYNCQTDFDGTHVEFTTDSGQTWHTLGNLANAVDSNWYNSPVLQATQESGWSGKTWFWVKCYFNLYQFNNFSHLAFRFVFTSDTTNPSGFFLVDDFCITPAPDVDLHVDSFAIQPSGTINATVPVNCKILNLGLLPISNFNVHYTYNGQLNGPFVYNGTLTPGSSAIINCGNLNVAMGGHAVTVFTSAPNDADLNNDSITRPITIVPSSPMGCDDFELSSSWTPEHPIATNRWQLGTPYKPPTVYGAHSGQKAWGVNILGINDKGGTCLYSPVYFLDSLNAHRITFWQNYNLYSVSGAGLLEYSLNGSAFQPLGTQNNINGINWYHATSPLFGNSLCWGGTSNGWEKGTYTLEQPYFRGQFQLRYFFNATMYGNTTNSITFDDFCINEIAEADAGAISVASPENIFASGVKVALKVGIQNFGLKPISNVPIFYTIGGTTIGPYIYSDTILPGADTQVIIDSVVLATGATQICIYTQQPNDTAISNDTYCTTINAYMPLSLPYKNNFDTPDSIWYATDTDPGTSWQLGTPTFLATAPVVYSSPNCWGTNLHTGYHNYAEAYLYSPFFDFSSTVGQTLRFYQKYDTEEKWDGHRMEYRFGDGPWQVLGSFGMAGALNWYNIDSLNATNLPAWCGNMPNWQKVELYDLNAMAGKQAVQFRFVFNADMVISRIGSFIDNFEIDEPKYNSVANQTLDLVTNPVVSNAAKKIQTEIKNVGYNPLYSCCLSVIVDNTILVTDTVYFNPPLPFGKIYWVTSTFNLTKGNHTICTRTYFPNGVGDSITHDDLKCKTTYVFPLVNNIPPLLNIDSIANGFNTQRPLNYQTTDLPYTDKTIKVHPNPVSQFLYVNYTGKVPDVLQIFTATGLLVKQEKLNTQNHKFFIGTLENGVYYIKLKSAPTGQKFVVMH